MVHHVCYDCFLNKLKDEEKKIKEESDNLHKLVEEDKKRKMRELQEKMMKLKEEEGKEFWNTKQQPKIDQIKPKSFIDTLKGREDYKKEKEHYERSSQYKYLIYNHKQDRFYPIIETIDANETILDAR